MLDESRAAARDAVETLVPDVADGWDVVVVEPTDAVMLQTDYHDLLDGDASDVPDADVATVSANTYGVMEYVDAHRLDEDIDLDAPTESLTYHGHCHQKATKKDHHAVGVLRRAGYGVDPLDSSCCGMAGSFGYEAEHYSMSKAIGRILFDQVAESDGDEVVAPGASCRSQLKERDGGAPSRRTRSRSWRRRWRRTDLVALAVAVGDPVALSLSSAVEDQFEPLPGAALDGPPFVRHWGGSGENDAQDPEHSRAVGTVSLAAQYGTSACPLRRSSKCRQSGRIVSAKERHPFP